MYGFFLPGREAAQYYYEQQAEVEVHLQTGAGLAGWCSDLKKCFNTLGRHPIMLLGLHLGLPGPWLHAWQMFLSRNQRRFQVRGGLGEPLSSANGMPEGYGLSTVAMCLVDLSFHAFFKAFQPEVMSFSFVDNFAVLADTAAALFRAWIAFLSFCEMWRVEPDADKTLAWALNKPDAALLQGTRVEQTASGGSSVSSEAGGALREVLAIGLAASDYCEQGNSCPQSGIEPAAATQSEC